MFPSLINKMSIDPTISTNLCMAYLEASRNQVVSNVNQNIGRLKEHYSYEISDAFIEQFVEGSKIALNTIEERFYEELIANNRETIRVSEVFSLLHSCFESVALTANMRIVYMSMNNEQPAEFADADGDVIKAIEAGSHLGQTVVMLTLSSLIIQKML